MGVVVWHMEVIYVRPLVYRIRATTEGEHMNLEHYRRLLLAKEKVLLADMAITGGEALHAGDGEVQDDMDRVVRSEEKAALIGQNSNDFSLLQQVLEALRRIEAGTYGTCLQCGGSIEEKRLDAVPWTAFDRLHQEEADRAESRPTGGATL